MWYISYIHMCVSYMYIYIWSLERQRQEKDRDREILWGNGSLLSWLRSPTNSVSSWRPRKVTAVVQSESEGLRTRGGSCVNLNESRRLINCSSSLCREGTNSPSLCLFYLGLQWIEVHPPCKGSMLLSPLIQMLITFKILSEYHPEIMFRKYVDPLRPS